MVKSIAVGALPHIGCEIRVLLYVFRVELIFFFFFAGSRRGWP